MTASPSERLARGTRPDLRLLAPAVGCWTVTVVGVVAGAIAAMAAVTLCVVVVGATLWLRRRGDLLARSTVLLIVATAGVTGGFGVAIAMRDIHIAAHPIAAAGLIGHKATVDLSIGDDPRAVRGPGPPRVRIPVTAVLHRTPTSPVAASLTAPADGWSELVPGQHVTAVVTVDRPYRADLTAAALRATGPPSAVSAAPRHQRWAATIRQRFAALSRRTLPAAESGLLPGLVLGDVSGLDDGVADDFRRCGLTHLTAVSGANFAIVCGTVLLVLQAAGVGRRTAAVLAGVALVCFVVLVRPSPSVIRAAVMGALGLIAMVAGRRSQAIPALAAAVIAVLGLWPSLAVDPGFALSVCATAALIALAPRIRDRLCAAGLPTPAAELLAIAIAAQVVTAPLIAMFAGTINVVGVVANLTVALAVAPITVLGTGAAVVAGLVAPVGELLVRFCEPALWWMVRTADLLARIPGASIAVPDGVSGAIWVTLCPITVVTAVVAARRWWRGEPLVAAPVGDRLAAAARTWTVTVGRLWHDGRRDRPTAPDGGRRGLPCRTRHRRRPRGGASGRRRRRPARHPRAGR